MLANFTPQKLMIIKMGWPEGLYHKQRSAPRILKKAYPGHKTCEKDEKKLLRASKYKVLSMCSKNEKF
jgi:hypothetical protein